MGTVRREAVRKGGSVETARKEGPAETVRDITAGSVRRGTVRKEEQAQTVRGITAGSVRREAARKEERIVRDITGITTVQTVQTITAGSVRRGTVRKEEPAATITADAETAHREAVRITAADRAEEIRWDAR